MFNINRHVAKEIVFMVATSYVYTTGIIVLALFGAVYCVIIWPIASLIILVTGGSLDTSKVVDETHPRPGCQ